MTNSKNGFSKILKSNVPDGPIDKKWTSHKNKINLVSPANKRNLDVIVVELAWQEVLQLLLWLSLDIMSRHFVFKTHLEELTPLQLKVE